MVWLRKRGARPGEVARVRVELRRRKHRISGEHPYLTSRSREQRKNYGTDRWGVAHTCRPWRPFSFVGQGGPDWENSKAAGGTSQSGQWRLAFVPLSTPRGFLFLARGVTHGRRRRSASARTSTAYSSGNAAIPTARTLCGCSSDLGLAEPARSRPLGQMGAAPGDPGRPF
jgi:hypothetical protein